MKTLDPKRASPRRKSNILRDGNCTVGDLGKDIVLTRHVQLVESEVAVSIHSSLVPVGHRPSKAQVDHN